MLKADVTILLELMYVICFVKSRRAERFTWLFCYKKFFFYNNTFTSYSIFLKKKKGKKAQATKSARGLKALRIQLREILIREDYYFVNFGIEPQNRMADLQNLKPACGSDYSSILKETL